MTSNKQSYLLATCGNDSLVKLWRIDISHDDKRNEPGGSNDDGISFKMKKQLSGHGGNVMDIRFSPTQGEILGSVATDKTARLWSVVCILQVLHIIINHRYTNSISINYYI